MGRQAQAKLEAARIKDTQPSRPLDDYVGSYSDDLYSQFRISKAEGRLIARFGRRLVADLEHWHFDTFRGTWRDRGGKVFVTFHLGADGKPEELVADFEGPVRFKRAPQ